LNKVTTVLPQYATAVEEEKNKRQMTSGHNEQTAVEATARGGCETAASPFSLEFVAVDARVSS